MLFTETNSKNTTGKGYANITPPTVRNEDVRFHEIRLNLEIRQTASVTFRRKIWPERQSRYIITHRTRNSTGPALSNRTNFREVSDGFRVSVFMYPFM